MFPFALFILGLQIAYSAGRKDEAEARSTTPDDRLYSESRTWGVR